MSLGRNLQYLRQLSGNMTQENLADRLNVSRQTISKWEMDVANPEMEKALELCKIFNCSLDNPFVTIPGAYGTLNDFMRTNGLIHDEDGIIPCFETDGESMDVYIACK